jgi:hypothetical protein
MFETVYTVPSYYDGPRTGIADYHGKPHLFQSEFRDFRTGLDGEPPDDDAFLLMPIDQAVFELALEDGEIWRRWEMAASLGIASIDTHPALPEEQSGHREIQRLLEGRLDVDPAKSVRKGAEFRVRNDPAWSGHGIRPLEVRWFDLK